MVHFETIIFQENGTELFFRSDGGYYKHQFHSSYWKDKPLVSLEHKYVRHNESALDNFYGVPRNTCRGLTLIYGTLTRIMGELDDPAFRHFILHGHQLIRLIIRPTHRFNLCYIISQGEMIPIRNISQPKEFLGRQG